MSPIIELVHRFTGIFSQTVLVFFIAGILIARYAPQQCIFRLCLPLTAMA
jgi:hypothetical protein